MTRKGYTLEEYKAKAAEVHKNKYDYSRMVSARSYDESEFICPVHGVFRQLNYVHLQGHGCPQCACDKVIKKNRFIKKAKKLHNGYYSYNNFEYLGSREKGEIICPLHGGFMQTPNKHLEGYGCPKCKKRKIENVLKWALMKKNVEFEEDGDEIKAGNIWVKCLKEGEVNDFEPEWGVVYFTMPQYFSNKGVGIELDGIYTNVNELVDYIVAKNNECAAKGNESKFLSDFKENINYMFNIGEDKGIVCGDKVIYFKTLDENEKDDLLELKYKNERLGRQCIIVFEDEYVTAKDIVFSKIKQLLGLNWKMRKVYGRKCEIRVIPHDEANEFLNINHIQGSVSSTLHLGAYYDGELVGVMLFNKESEGMWNLTRFATDNNSICSGVGGKLFKYFVRNYEFDEIKSFADRRWTINESDNVYTKLGFVNVGTLEPSYRYVNIEKDGLIRQHKFGFRKEKLKRKYGLSMTMTESEMTESLGYHKVWDCGLIKYVYKK